MHDTVGKLNGRKWCVALLVSPGMLFLFAYLLVFLSVNFYLNRAIKSYLSTCSLTSKTKTCTATASRLDVDFWLTSLTIHDLKLNVAPISKLVEPSSGRSREIFFPSVTISGNWFEALISLRSSGAEKFFVSYSSERTKNLSGTALIAPSSFEVALIPITGSPVTHKSEIAENNNPLKNSEVTSGDERINSMFVEVLTLLSREEL